MHHPNQQSSSSYSNCIIRTWVFVVVVVVSKVGNEDRGVECRGVRGRRGECVRERERESLISRYKDTARRECLSERGFLALLEVLHQN